MTGCDLTFSRTGSGRWGSGRTDTLSSEHVTLGDRIREAYRARAPVLCTGAGICRGKIDWRLQAVTLSLQNFVTSEP